MNLRNNALMFLGYLNEIHVDGAFFFQSWRTSVRAESNITYRVLMLRYRAEGDAARFARYTPPCIEGSAAGACIARARHLLCIAATAEDVLLLVLGLGLR